MRFNSPVRFPMILGSTFLLVSAVLVACGKTTNSSPPRATPPAPTTNYVNQPGIPTNYNSNNGGRFTPVSNTSTYQNYGNGNGNGNFAPVQAVQPGWNGSVTSQDELATFDPQEELKEGDLGHWVTIGSQPFFQPKLGPEDRSEDGPEGSPEKGNWQPIQHGYWSYETVRGFTWVSYDRFGAITDHYGYWRHHKTLGWVWGYGPELRYRASVVTWFDHGDNIGWYPATFDQPNLYTLDNRVGFDDGYWRGSQLLVQIGTPGFAFNVGFSVVNRRYMTSTDIATHCLDGRRNRDEIFSVAHQAQLTNRFSLYPGGNRENAYGFFVNRAGRAPLTSDVAIREVGHGRRMIGVTVNQAPAQLPPGEQRRAAALNPMAPPFQRMPHAQVEPRAQVEPQPHVGNARQRAPAPNMVPVISRPEQTVAVPKPNRVGTPPAATPAPAAAPAPVKLVPVKAVEVKPAVVTAPAPTAKADDATIGTRSARRGPRAAAPHIPVVDQTSTVTAPAPSDAANAPKTRTADSGADASAPRQHRRGNPPTQ